MHGQIPTLEQHNFQIEMQRRHAPKQKAGVLCTCGTEMEVVAPDCFSTYPKTKVECPACGRTGLKS